MNTKILILFAAILIYFTLFPDIETENEKLIRDIRMLEQKISTDSNITNVTLQTQKLIKKDYATDKKNLTLLIDPNIPDALVLSDLQQTLRNDVNATGIVLTNLSWGEPSSNNDTHSTLFPMSIATKGSPKGSAEFLSRLYQHRKLLTIENLSIVQYQNDLLIVADLYAYRQDTNNPKGEQQ